MRFRAVIATVSVVALSLAVTNAAFAACTKLSFTVNDYGKEGPTRDAKSLLDKYAAKWTGERGIKKFSVGPKDVACELFLNFIVFDEHTCTATANVCWDGAVPAPIQDAKAETPFVNKAAVAKAPKAAPATAAAGAAVAPVTTGSIKAAPAAAKAATTAAPKAPAAIAPVAAPAVPAVVVPAAPAALVVPSLPDAPAVAPAATGN